MARLTAETINDADIRKFIRETINGRLNAIKRAWLVDAYGALSGDATCREAVAGYINAREEVSRG